MTSTTSRRTKEDESREGGNDDSTKQQSADGSANGASATTNRTSAAASTVSVQDVASSLYSGVGEFIPVPFMDQYFTDRRQAQLVTNILDRRRVKYEPAVPQILAEGGQRTCCGCCGTVLKTCCLWPVEKCFKSCFFWLLVRRAVLTVCETYLLARFCHSNHLNAFVPETNTVTTPGSLFRKSKTTTTVDPASDAATPTITAQQANAWAKVFDKAVRHLDRRLARDGVRKIYKVIQQHRKRRKNNNNNDDDDDDDDDNLTSTDIGRVMEQESPGTLAEFDAYMARAFADAAVAR